MVEYYLDADWLISHKEAALRSNRRFIIITTIIYAVIAVVLALLVSLVFELIDVVVAFLFAGLLVVSYIPIAIHGGRFLRSIWAFPEKAMIANGSDVLFYQLTLESHKINMAGDLFEGEKTISKVTTVLLSEEYAVVMGFVNPPKKKKKTVYFDITLLIPKYETTEDFIELLSHEFKEVVRRVK